MALFLFQQRQIILLLPRILEAIHYRQQMRLALSGAQLFKKVKDYFRFPSLPRSPTMISI